MRTPPIGFPLQFFPSADTTVEPIAAMVTQVGMNGLVKLALFFPGGGEHKSSGEFVRHIGDPWVQENKYALMKARHGTPRGAWDWIPGLLFEQDMEEISPRQVKANEKELAKEERREEGLLKAGSMLGEGQDVEYVAKCVRTYGVSRQSVLDLAEKLTTKKVAEEPANV